MSLIIKELDFKTCWSGKFNEEQYKAFKLNNSNYGTSDDNISISIKNFDKAAWKVKSSNFTEVGLSFIDIHGNRVLQVVSPEYNATVLYVATKINKNKVINYTKTFTSPNNTIDGSEVGFSRGSRNKNKL